MTRAAALLLLIAGACVPGDGPMMKPFQDCLGCHSSSGNAKAWTIAGTWRKGVTVTVVDANGKAVSMRGNDAGNFYTREPLAGPVTVSVDGSVMKYQTSGAVIPITYGGCNLCHHAEQVTMTFGVDMAPGSPCLTCHGPNGMATTKFTAAGTFPPAGQTVTVGGQTAPNKTSAVGNFYITAPIAFPATATVGGSSMANALGDCNQCHGAGGVGD